MGKGKIEYTKAGPRYFDKNGLEITEGCMILFDGDSRIYEIYRTTEDELGVDATNPLWVETGRAAPCEYGIYPLSLTDVQSCRIIRK